MKLSKDQKKRLFLEESRRRALAKAADWYLCCRDIERAGAQHPSRSVFEKPELGNHRLRIRDGEKMAIGDRHLVFRRRMKLERKTCVIMDQFGGDFSCTAFEADGAELLIPIGHARHDLWPETPRLEASFEIGTDTGSLAFLSSGDVKEDLLDSCVLWPCAPGNYDFFYEELLSLGALKQPQARNIIVRREVTGKKGFWGWWRRGSSQG